MYVLFLALWIIFNGRFTLEILLLGIVIAAAILWFVCKFADYSLQLEFKLYKKIFLFVPYLVLLIKEIIKANLGVVHLILSQEEEIQPVLVTFESFLKTPTGKAFLANAITLTPGTITVSLEDSEFVVHCLDENLVEGVQGSDFEERLEEIEK